MLVDRAENGGLIVRVVDESGADLCEPFWALDSDDLAVNVAIDLTAWTRNEES